MPDDVVVTDLDREIRAELGSLPKQLAETVGRHLVAAGGLLDEAPEDALAHALAARRLAPRIGVVREAVGLAAYRAGHWQSALTELRTYHRMSGRQTHLAVIADCERALGRPERAIDLYREGQHAGLPAAEAVELLIVAAGARADLGQVEAALGMLQLPELSASEPTPWLARLRYAYAEALLALGRDAEARDWFARAAQDDESGQTGAAERLLELDGVILDDRDTDDPGVDAEDVDLPDVDLDPVGSVLPEPAPAEPAPAEPALAEPGLDGSPPANAEPLTAGAASQPPAPPRAAPEPGTIDSPLVRRYDLVILDLDGVVLLGEEPIPAAAEAIAALREAGHAVTFATNNASRTAEEVAEVLIRAGVPADPAEILTASMVAADALAGQLPAGSPVLVVGADALSTEVARAGLRPVSAADEQPVAVVQGFGPQVGWSLLAEASVAIRAGARWLVTNTDATLPSPRGPLPGNGALVAALRTALGRGPDEVVGKPQPAFFAAASRRFAATTPLVVGDRLETDIAGAVGAGMDSLLVLTGVSDHGQAVAAPTGQRPTYVGADLSALFEPPRPVPAGRA